MKAKLSKELVLIIIIFLITSVILTINRKTAYTFKAFSPSAFYRLSNENPVDQMIGHINGYDQYNDYFVESYQDLVQYSDIIVTIKAGKTESLGKASYVHCFVQEPLKGDLKKEEEITVIEQAHVGYNAHGKTRDDYYFDPSGEITIILKSPFGIMEQNREYLLFLNRIDQQKNIYHTSTLFYSIIPLKETIKIFQINTKDEYERYFHSIPVSKGYDYIAVSSSSYDFHQENVGDPYKDRISQAFHLASGYARRYQQICEEALKAINRSTVFTVQQAE